MTRREIEFLYLTQADVEAAGLDMAMTLDIVEQTFALHNEGKINLPHKTVLDLGERERGRVNAMPAYVGGKFDVCGIKWISGFPQNPQKHNLPRGIGQIIINDSWTGVPLAIMDATLISALRTGAVSGIGAKYLAGSNAETLALIGAGVQARTQLDAIVATVPGLKRVQVYDPNTETARTFANDMMQAFSAEVHVAADAQEAVEGADIIVTATVANEPIVKDAWIKPGSLFIHVGSYQEEEYAVVTNSDMIVVDDWEAVLHRVTPILAKMYLEGQLKEADIDADLGEIVQGKKPGRKSDDQRIFFAPIGMAMEDVAVAFEVYRQAKERGLGRTLPLFG